MLRLVDTAGRPMRRFLDIDCGDGVLSSCPLPAGSIIPVGLQLDIRRAALASVTMEEDDTATQWWLYALLTLVVTHLCPANTTRRSYRGEPRGGQGLAHRQVMQEPESVETARGDRRPRRG
jgi:hypothetical protein